MPPRHRIMDRIATRLKLKQLRLLVAVGQQGNIKGAAAELGISQPAATKMVQDLELDFEVLLFERGNRGVTPTPYGAALIRHGKLIFAQIANAAQELEDLGDGTKGRIVVGTLLAASSHLLPLAIDRILQDRPRLSIKVVEGTNGVLMPALRGGEIDLVVGRLSTHRHRAELVQETLFDEGILAVARAAHPLSGKANLRFEALTSYGWILPPVETSLRRQIDQFFLREGQFVPRTWVDSVSYLTNRALLCQRDLIGLLPAHVVAHDIENGTLCALDWPVPFGNGPVGVTYRKSGPLSPAGAAFVSALRNVAAAL